MHKRYGFTIVELLIVIVVIAILAAITIVAYNGILQRSHDSTRKADINALAKALEVNYINHGGYTQPENMCSDTSYGGLGGCGDSGGTGNWDANSDLRDLITDNLLSSLPLDPVNDSTYHYSYEPSSLAVNGFDGYSLCAKLETTGANYCQTQHK